MRAALDRGEGLVERLVAGQQILLARGEQDRQDDAQLGAIAPKSPFRERQCVRGAPGHVEEISQIAGRGHDLGMIGPECIFADDQRATIERLGVTVALLVLVEAGEIVQRAGDVGMIRSQHLIPDRERALDRRFRVRIAIEIAIDLAEIVQDGGHRRMLGAASLLVDRERPLKQRLGFGIVLLLHIERGEIIE
ncbi:hypothetical protein ACVWXM_003035 [Bradyrhizobium sp. GM7.3]